MLLLWLKDFILTLLLREKDVKWVVNDRDELGVRVGNQYYFLYKGRSIVYRESHENGNPMLVRPVRSREFGEVCRVPGLKREPDDRNGFYFEGDDWEEITPGEVNFGPSGLALSRMRARQAQ